MAFMGSSGDMQTTVTIGGNSMPLQAAVDQAVSALNLLSARLDGMSAQSESTGFAMGNLGQVFTSSGFSLQGLLDVVGLSSGPLGAFTGLIGQVAGGIGSMIEQSVAFVGAMAAWSILQTVTGWVQQLSDELFNLQVTTQRLDTGWQYIFGGPQHGGVAASRNLMTWSSQFSMGIPFTRQDLMSAITTLSTTGMTPAQIEQFMPYLSDIAATYGSASYGGRGTNLQQASNAIRMASQGLSRMLKYDLNITPEELVPYGLVGKASSTGFHITDQNSLYRALENFAQAKGVAGASGGIVGSTWWGGWSSLVDNIQNFLLQVGGTNLNGTIQPGSFFGVIQQHLDQLLGWFTAHQGEIKHFADLLSHLLGDVVNAGGGLIGEFINWLNKLGAVQWIESGIERLDTLVRQWFGLDKASAPADKKHPMGHRQQLADQINGNNTQSSWMQQMTSTFSQLGQAIGQISWSDVSAFFGQLASYLPSIAGWTGQLAQDMLKFFTTMTPDERAQMRQFFKQLGDFLGTNLVTSLELIDTGLKTLQAMLPTLLPLLNDMVTLAELNAQMYLAWATSINAVVTEWDNLNNSGMPLWLISPFAKPPSIPNPFSGGGGSSSTSWNSSTYGAARNNATSTPGGYRQFGTTGGGSLLAR